MMAAATYGNPGHIFTSSDSGTSWTMRAPELNTYWQGIAMSSNGKYLIAGAYNGNVYSSNDFGITWYIDSPLKSSYQVAISADGTKKLATAQDGIYGYGMPVISKPTPSATPVAIKGTIQSKKISADVYILTVSSNAKNLRFTITATKKGSKTLTVSGKTTTSGYASVSLKGNLAGYSLKLYFLP
jgi:hypothetical protein